MKMTNDDNENQTKQMINKLYMIDEHRLRSLLTKAFLAEALMDAHVDYCWKGYSQALDDYTRESGDFLSLIEESLKRLEPENDWVKDYLIETYSEQSTDRKRGGKII